MSIDRISGRVALAALALLLLVPGCTDFKRAIGMEKVSPDEFAVEARAPLTIPPDFDLRPPQPGAPRPQEASASTKAQGVIDNAGPGEPGKQQVGTLKFPGAAAPATTGGQPGDATFVNNLLQYSGASAVVEKRETSSLQVY
jgi:hypothetical protein